MLENLKKDKKTFYLSLVATFVLLIILVGATYAYFVGQGGDTTSQDVSVTSNTTDLLTFEISNDINFTVRQSDFTLGGSNKSGTATARAILRPNNNTGEATEHYYLYLSLNDNGIVYSSTNTNQDPELMLQVFDESNQLVTLTGLGEQVTIKGVTGYDITGIERVIPLLDNEEITASGGATATEEWRVVVTLINLNVDQNDNTNKTVSGSLIIRHDSMPKCDVYSDTDLACYLMSNSNASVPNLYHHGTTQTVNALTTVGNFLENSIDYSVQRLTDFSGIDYVVKQTATLAYDNGLTIVGPWHNYYNNGYFYPPLNSTNRESGFSYYDYEVVFDNGSTSYYSNGAGAERDSRIVAIEAAESSAEILELFANEPSNERFRAKYALTFRNNEMYVYTTMLHPGIEVNFALGNNSSYFTLGGDGDGTINMYVFGPVFNGDYNGDYYIDFSIGNIMGSRETFDSYEALYEDESNFNSVEDSVDNFALGGIIWLDIYFGEHHYVDAGDNSFRYYGSNPNNFVCFGSDASTCPDENLYRIIGIVPVEMVVDENNSSTYNNTVTKYLYKLIKHNYFTDSEVGMTGYNSSNEQDTTYIDQTNIITGNVRLYDPADDDIDEIHLYEHDKYYSTEIYSYDTLFNNYLENMDDEWSNKIATVMWKDPESYISYYSIHDEILDYLSSNLYDSVHDVYVNDRQSQTVRAKVKPMYVSDYGYASNIESWIGDFYQSYDSNYDQHPQLFFNTNNWLNRGFDEQIYFYQLAYGVVSDYRYSTGLVRPTFYLKENVVIDRTTHTGTKVDPYRIK